MRTVIIAGGVSKRLRPLTESIPKTLLSLNERKILEHILDSSQAAGLTDFYILTGHGHAAVDEFIQEYTAQHPNISVQLHFIDRYAETGNIIAVEYLVPLMKDDTVVINSDTIFHEQVMKELVNSAHPNAMLVDDQKELGVEEMKVLVNEQGNVFKIHKSLNPTESHGEYVGILKFSPEVGPALLASAQALMLDNQMLYYEDAIQKMIDDAGIEIKSISTQGLPVMEIDTHEDLEAAKKLASLL